MSQFSLGYHSIEDRIWVKFGGETYFWFTRSLLEKYLGPSSSLLEKTVPGGEIPYALPPSQRIKIDHEVAMTREDDTSPITIQKKSGPKIHDYQGKSKLVHGLKTKANNLDWILTLVVENKEITFIFNRIDYHRFLQGLVIATEKAKWSIPNLPEWVNKSV